MTLYYPNRPGPKVDAIRNVARQIYIKHGAGRFAFRNITIPDGFSTTVIAKTMSREGWIKERQRESKKTRRVSWILSEDAISWINNQTTKQ